MNKESIVGNVNELKGKAIKKWAKLTDNDFTGFKGDLTELKGKVQQLYGYTKEQVEKEFTEFKKDLGSEADKSKIH